MGGTLDDEIRRMEAQAREGLVAQGQNVRWEYWITFKWHYAASESTMQEHLDAFRKIITGPSRGGPVLYTGLQADPMVHAHGLLHLSRRLRFHLLNHAEAEFWLRERWTHGPLWVEPFDANRFTARSSLHYLAAHPGTVSW